MSGLGPRSRWLAGWVAALSTFAGLIVVFLLLLTLYYTEGALDAGAIEPVTSSLFPYLGSSVTVDPAAGGLAWSVEPGPVPLVAALVVWILVAKPWRSIGSQSPATNMQAS